MPLADDKVWFDSERKLSGLVADIRSEIESGNNVLVLSHFPAALTRLIRSLTDGNIQHRSYSAYDVAQIMRSRAGNCLGRHCQSI